MEDDRLELGMDLDAPEEPSYLRRQKRVEVHHRSVLSVRKLARLKWPAVALAALAVLGFAAYSLYQYAITSDRFLLRAEGIEITGARYVTHSQVVERFTNEIGRSVFSLSLAGRRAAIEQIAWVESADTARVWPNRILVVVRERTPVAFLRTANGLVLVDASGQLLDRPARASFSFPVVTGMSELDSPEERRKRMGLFNAVLQDLDREGARYSKDLSEVDVSDPEDARVVTGESAVLLHLGPNGFLQRYKTYLSHIQEWRQSIPKIHSVDLRYDRQIVVN